MQAIMRVVVASGWRGVGVGGMGGWEVGGEELSGGPNLVRNELSWHGEPPHMNHWNALIQVTTECLLSKKGWGNNCKLVPNKLAFCII